MGFFLLLSCENVFLTVNDPAAWQKWELEDPLQIQLHREALSIRIKLCLVCTTVWIQHLKDRRVETVRVRLLPGILLKNCAIKLSSSATEEAEPG